MQAEVFLLELILYFYYEYRRYYMARRARCMSISTYSHVILRGIGRQLLFEDDWDYRHLLNRMERYSLETNVKICAYCLMENHVHFLLHGEKTDIILFMRKLGVSYAGYFNKKYERVGHLFQNRYLSEPIETEKYLLTAFRYILQNPEKAGISSTSGYKWSSYRLYKNPPEYMDLSLIKTMLGDFRNYEKFVTTPTDEVCMDFEKRKHDDEWAKKELLKCLGVPSGTELQTYGKIERNVALAILKEHGLTIRQIERLTGINRNIVQKA